MKQKEIIAFLSGYSTSFLSADQMVKMAKEYTRKSMASKVEFGFEFGINSKHNSFRTEQYQKTQISKSILCRVLISNRPLLSK